MQMLNSVPSTGTTLIFFDFVKFTQTYCFLQREEFLLISMNAPARAESCNYLIERLISVRFLRVQPRK